VGQVTRKGEVYVRIDRPKAAAISFTLVAAFAQGAAAQVTCTLTVTGQNDPAVDVAAVQAAVSAPAIGDTVVCLQGIFDFGTPPPGTNSSVTVAQGPSATSMRIVGLDDTRGKKATIRNGTQALTKVTVSPPFFSIENLRFEGPTFSAVSILGAGPVGTLKLTGLNVVGVKTFLFPAFNVKFRNAIAISSALNTIAGDIDISNNVLDGGVYDFANDLSLAVSAGISLTGAVAGVTNQPFTARVHIADNKISNWSGSGILAGGIRETTIERNAIQPGAFANVIAMIPPGCAAANGLGSASGIALASVNDATVRDNTITMVAALNGAGAAPMCSAGIVIVGLPAVAPGTANGNLVYRNRIRGVGNYAIDLGQAGSSETENLFALNKLGNFTPVNASLYVQGADNDFVGNFPTVEGNVAGNVLIDKLP
jgi:hypothetical protein